MSLVAAAIIGFALGNRVLQEEPSFEELSTALTPVVARLGLDAEIRRDVRDDGLLGGNSQVTARVSDVIAGEPEMVVGEIADVLERKGYQRVAATAEHDIYSASWVRKGIQIDSAVQGVAGEGEQSISVGLTASPAKN